MRGKKLATVLGTVMLAGSLLLAGCSSSATNGGNKQSGNTIKIGGNFELSGAAAAYGQAMQRGTELAVSQINKDGGVKVNGKKLKLQLVQKDNKSDNSQVASVASNLATQSKVVASVGPITSGADLAALPNYTKAKVPLITPGGTQDSLTVQKNGKVQPYMFRSCFEDSYQGKALAKYVYSNMKLKRVAILADKSTDYAQGLTKAFKKEFKGQVVQVQYYQAGDKDFNTLLTKLKGKKFDALFVPGYYSEAGLIVKQARQMGITQPIVGADGFADPKLVQIAGKKNASNIYYTTHFDPKATNNAKATAYMKAYKAKYNEQAGTFDALAYDATYMIKDAIENEKSADSTKIATGLSNLKNFKGVTGTITMDKKHNPQKPVIIAKVENGEEVQATSVK
ncbi:ABC transporter substrate-binding protein [Loigolactobacillus backii]|uniref:Branched-chain amino acid ABC transporter substrate-binding protein n=1 Tax=Loigolactobacillus backii TaxID=375175 RepID=A0A192GYY4_9LACO|nr:ABC transporter substrate-binding protein [Loigolactobacillus backii]ANK60694.1 branched-chain amino acid ABC transporter substrate-binding protein [Loigolactobacillus backii]ANK61739.1 branched-chain amino acid ABC transporter substrate-binding protein [Loigolactobacillus backii]ANK65647.1 branched-chain amino acid ABC transporter substrate-binding protein [Loigolactobacillus backii]ANK68124.1 branched-chain amino acid ABC transporter substrate-binding protein [Loigolactobacillus backii]AN